MARAVRWGSTVGRCFLRKLGIHLQARSARDFVANRGWKIPGILCVLQGFPVEKLGKRPAERRSRSVRRFSNELRNCAEWFRLRLLLPNAASGAAYIECAFLGRANGFFQVIFAFFAFCTCFGSPEQENPNFRNRRCILRKYGMVLLAHHCSRFCTVILLHRRALPQKGR